MDIVKPNTAWHVRKAIYGLRDAPRLWQQERDQKLSEKTEGQQLKGKIVS